MKILDHQRLNEKLQRINDEKTRYLLQATHQLKAPFAAIQSYTDIMLGGFTGPLPDKSVAEIDAQHKKMIEHVNILHDAVQA